MCIGVLCFFFFLFPFFLIICNQEQLEIKPGDPQNPCLPEMLLPRAFLPRDPHQHCKGCSVPGAVVESMVTRVPAAYADSQRRGSTFCLKMSPLWAWVGWGLRLFRGLGAGVRMGRWAWAGTGCSSRSRAVGRVLRAGCCFLGVTGDVLSRHWQRGTCVHTWNFPRLFSCSVQPFCACSIMFPLRRFLLTSQKPNQTE